MSLFNRIKEGINNKIEERKQQRAEEKKIKQEIDVEVKKEVIKTRTKEEIKTAIMKEKMKAESKRKYIKSGGFVGAMSRIGETVSSNASKTKKKEQGIENPFNKIKVEDIKLKL